VSEEGGVELGGRVLDGVPLPATVLADPDRVVVRLEGWPEEVEEQTAAARSITTFDEIGDPFPEECFPDARIVAEAAVVPSRLPQLLVGIERYRAMIGVGIAWVPFEDDEALTAFRARAAELGGIAPVIRGPGRLGDGGVPAPDVQRRIRTVMDPAGILAPGRAWSA
jgi:hypothetical protein